MSPSGGLPEQFLTIAEVAGKVGLCRATIYALVERGEEFERAFASF